MSLARGKVIALPRAGTSQPANQVHVGYPVGHVTIKVVFLPTEPTIGGGSLLSSRLALLLSALTFQVSRHSLTLQFRAELHFELETVADWSQFCCKPMLNFDLFFTDFFLMVVGRGGNIVEI